MSIYKTAVSKPISTIMIFVGVLIFGLYCLTRIPVDLYPELEMPSMSIMTVYPGASAVDIEENITRYVEDAVNSVDKLKELNSTSKDNISIVSLEFEWGTNLDESVNDVREALDRAYADFPDDCDRPTIYKFSTSMMPILFYTITANENYAGLEKLIEQKIVNPLNRVDGVASVFLSGAPERTIYVEVDAQKLEAYNLTVEKVGEIIASSNLDMPSGSVRMGRVDYQLRVEGQFDNSDEIRDLVVGNVGGKNVFVRDIAEVKDTIKDITIAERSNGGKGMRMMIMKQSGANTVSVAASVNKRMAELEKALPKDVQILQVYDSSKFIKSSIANLSETLFFALIFVVLVILFFLGRWRASFIIIITIPISLIVAFAYLYLTGSSINIISLSSLSIAIGMVVDDAIVVLENITKHIERGARPREAAIYATNEVWVSVIATTLVVVAVFLPLTTLSGMVGIMFSELGWIVTITVVTSTIAAITLTPMLSAYMLKLRDKDERLTGYARFHQKYIEKKLDRLDSFYERLLRWALNHKKVIMISTMSFFVASLFLFRFVGTDFMPETDESRFSATVEVATGMRVEETLKTTEKIEKLLKERYPEVLIVSSSSGADDEGGFSSLFSNSGTNTISFTIRLVDIEDRNRSVFTIADDFREQLKQFPEIVEYTVNTGGGAGAMGGSGNNVSIEIYGYDLNATNRVAQEIKNKVGELKGAKDITISRKKDKPELQVDLDKEKMAQNGLTTAMVSSYLRNRVGGLISSIYREDGEEYDIIVRLSEPYRNAVTNIEDINIMTPQGKSIKLRELGQVKEYWGPPNIERKRRERVVKVDVTPVGIPLGTLATQIKEKVKEVNVPNDMVIDLAGAYEDQQESFADMGMLLMLIFALVFIVMASQFESFAKPFVIAFAIPFAFTGVIFALLLTGTTLNMIASLGAILLVGIVVKNGIVLVDFINLMRDRDMELNEAIAVSGKSRLRPVLMTTATTILGMLPMALSIGEGAEMWSPMGITVIGGLTVSTIVTLVIVPVMYALVARHGERDKAAKLRKEFQVLND